MTSRWMVCVFALLIGCSSDNGGEGGTAGDGGSAGEGGTGGDGGSGGDGGTAGAGGAAGDGGTAGEGGSSGEGGGGGMAFPLLDPIAAWSFSGDAMDDTGNGNDGTVQGATLTDDRFGNLESAYSFDGNDEIGIGNNVKPNFPFTFNVWIRNESGRGIMANDDVNSNGFRWGAGITLNVSGGFVATVFSGFATASTRRGVRTDPDVVRPGEWQMVTAVFASLLDTRIYVDGAEVPVVSNGGTGNSLTYSNASGNIGSPDRGSGSGAWLPFQGEIDDVSVFDRALSDEEIETLYGGFTTQTP